MKSKIIMLLCVLSVSLFSFKSITQDTVTAMANYDGFEYDMYSFTIPAKNDDEADEIIAFNDVPEAILKEFDLKSDELVGVDFEITYKVVVDEDVEEDELPEEVNILIALKKVSKKK